MARFSIISKDGNVVRYEGKPKYVGSYLKPSHLEFSEIASPTPIAWEIGDYVDYPRTGMRYRLYSIPQASKNARSGSHGGAFTYSNVQFHAATKELEIAPFRDLVENDNNIHFSTSPDVATFEDVNGIVRRIQACMDDLYPGRWEIRVAEFDSASDADIIEKISQAKDFALSGGTCLDALSKIYEMWQDIGWIHSHENGKEVITVGYANKRIDANTTSSFMYGKGKGLTAIKRNQTNKDEFATRLYIYGSDRNLPARYYNGKPILNAESVDIRNLMIPSEYWGKTDGRPDARKAYIENAEAVAKYGVIPKTHYFDSEDSGADIYPSIKGMTVGQVRHALSLTQDTTYSPSYEFYPDENERVDMLKSGSYLTDDGVLNNNGKQYIHKAYINFGTLTSVGTLAAGSKGGKIGSIELLNDTFRYSGAVNAETKTEISGRVYDYGYFSKVTIEVEYKSYIEADGEVSKTRTFEITEKDADGFWPFNISVSLSAKNIDGGGEIDSIVAINVYAECVSALISDVTTLAEVNATGDVSLKKYLAPTFGVVLKQIGFDINERASMGEGKTLVMNTGSCAGRSFVIESCAYSDDSDAWVLTCRRQQDDTLGMLFPNSTYQLSEGDVFVLTEIAMPESYILVNEERLYNEGQKLLARASKVQATYEPSIDAKWMVENGAILREGMFMSISDEDVVDGQSEHILIDTLNIYEDDNAIPTYRVTLKERRKVSYKGTPSATATTSTRSVESGTTEVEVDLSGYAKTEYVDRKVGEVSSEVDTFEEAINSILDWFTLKDGVLLTKYNLASEKEVSAKGINASQGGGTSYNRLDSWSAYDSSKAGYVLSALLGYDLHSRVTNLENAEVDLSDYYTKSETNSQIASAIGAIDLSPYATKAALSILQGQHDTLRSEFDALNNLLSSDTTDYINTWNEVVAFLDGYKDESDLATILSGMNADISSRLLASDFESWKTNTFTPLENLVANHTTRLDGVDKTIEDHIAEFIAFRANFEISDDLILVRKNFASTEEVSAKGINQGTGGGGGSSYSRLDTWEGYDNNKAGYVLSAGLGYGLKVAIDELNGYDLDNRVRSIENSYVSKDAGGVVNGGLVVSSLAIAGGSSSQFLKADGSLDSTSYLPTSGGTIRGGVLEIDSSLAAPSFLRFKDRRINSAGGYADNILKIIDADGNSHGALGLYGVDNGVFYYYLGCESDAYNGNNFRVYADKVSFGEYTILHSGNIGSQSVNYATSAGNADTLDGLHADIFVKSYLDNTDNLTRFTNSAFIQTAWISGQGDFGSLVIPTWTGNTASTYFTTELRFNIDSTNPKIRITNQNGTSDWYTLARTVDNVASAQALTHSNGTVGATVDVYGGICLSTRGIWSADGGLALFDFDGANLNVGYSMRNSYRTDIYGNTIGFKVGDTARMLINSSGNVLIGTTAGIGHSTAKLQIYENVNEWVGICYTDKAAVSMAHSLGYGMLVTSKSYNENKYLLSVRYNDSGLEGAGNTAFVVYDNGNVGIGTANPQYKLDVAGDVGITSTNGYLDLVNGQVLGNATLTIGVNGTSYAQIQTSHYGVAYTCPLYINPHGGNVLIGTTTDRGHRLAVGRPDGAGYLTSTTLNNSLLFVGMSNSIDSYGTNFWTEGSGNGFIQQGRTDEEQPQTYNLILQPFGGNVGVGTSSPSYKLDVIGDIRATESITIGGATLSWENGALKVNTSFYSEKEISAKGLSTGGGSGASYNRLDAWGDYDSSKAGYVLSAGLGYDLNTRLSSLSGVVDTHTSRLSSLENAGYITSSALSGYLPLSGGTMNVNSYLCFRSYSAIEGGGGWALPLLYVTNREITDNYALIGAYGSNNDFHYWFIGTQNYNGLNLRIGDNLLRWGDDDILHSGNIGNYAITPSTIGSQSVAYATNAGTLGGYAPSYGSNTPWGTIPVITQGGWTEMGKHIEFHYDNTTGSDFSTALICTGNYANIVNLPSASGTLALTTDNVASATKLATARTIWGQSFDGTGNVGGDLSDVTFLKIRDYDYGIYKGNYFGGLAASDIVFTAPNLYFYTSKFSMLINPYGNVTIGATDLASSSYRLYVDGTARIAAISEAECIYHHDSDKGYFIGLRNVGLGVTTGGLLLYSYGATPMSFYTNGGERMRITASGNVGIGIDYPQYKLHVDGTGYFSDALTANGGLSVNSTLTVSGLSTFTGGVVTNNIHGNGQSLYLGNESNNAYIKVREDMIGSSSMWSIPRDGKAVFTSLKSDTTLTVTGASTLSTVSASSISTTELSVNGQLTVYDRAYMKDIYPTTNNESWLGYDGLRWNNIYSHHLNLSGTATVNTIKIKAGQSIQFEDSSGNLHTLKYDSTKQAFVFDGNVNATGEMSAKKLNA